MTRSEVKAADTSDSNPREIVKRILSENFARYRGTYVFAIMCMVVVSGMTAYSAYIIKNVVNDVFDKRDLNAAYTIAGIILIIFFLRGIAAFGQDVLLNRIGNNIIATYQRRVYDHLLHLGVGFFNDTRSAYLVGQVNQNISGIRNLMNQLVTVFARDLLTFIGLIFVMIWQDPLMTAGSFVVLPVAGYVISRYVKRVKKLSRKEVHTNARVASVMVETAQGIPVVKAFTMEDQLRGRVDELVKTAERQANHIALVNARTKPLTETLAGLAIAGSVAFGGWRVIALGGDPGALLSFLAAAMLAYDPARRLAAFRVQFEKSLVNARMIYELLDTPPRQADKPDAREFSAGAGEVAVENVTFTYGEGEPIIRDISFVAQAGKTTALVGPSGGGKTTLMSLILRLHDLDSGRILVDGQDIADLRIASLREKVAYVSQHAVLFEGTVAENISYARPGATREEIEQAARLALAHDFIVEMPLGYDTPVGEMGTNLSGGQRQRLSIARAIVRDAPILLLDEATSALDNESERLVQAALDELMKDRTTIVIAHRLSTIHNADKIVVIDQGRVVEQGSHDVLMNSESGLYGKLQSLSAMPPSNGKKGRAKKSGSKTGGRAASQGKARAKASTATRSGTGRGKTAKAGNK